MSAPTAKRCTDMTGDELADAARALWGEHDPRAIAKLAVMLGASTQNVMKLVKGYSDIAPSFAAKVHALLNVGPPPGGLAPLLNALAARAKFSGWTEEDIDADVSIWLNQRDGGGDGE
jgi:hypothetical protein